jgi:error-prone DNA polymerase
MPHIYEKYRQLVLEPKFICVFGVVQNQDGIVHLEAEHVEKLTFNAIPITSHDFH